VKDEAALGAGEEILELGKFRDQPCRLADPVGMELEHDVPPLDHLTRRRHRHPIMRQVATDDGEIGRRKSADIVTDKGNARALADQMDLEFRVEIPDVALPGIVIEPPEKAFVDAVMMCSKVGVLEENGPGLGSAALWASRILVRVATFFSGRVSLDGRCRRAITGAVWSHAFRSHCGVEQTPGQSAPTAATRSRSR
jgi:hypothetical protein